MKAIKIFLIIKVIKTSSLRGAIRDVAISLCFLLITISANAQQNNPLRVGDKIPDLMINNIINQSSDQIKLKELYKKGLLLIDFWFTSCTPCIKEMKFLDSLKARHPNQFDVLMVSYQDAKHIKDFLSQQKNTDIKTSNLILATNDTLLRKAFPHQVEPHNIWIDKNGIVIAITGTNEVTEQNILNFKTKGSIAGHRTKVDNFKFDPKNEFHEGDQSFTYRSIITPYNENVEGLMVNGNKKNGLVWNRFTAYNTGLDLLYWFAYSKMNANMRFNLMEVHTKDSLNFFSPSTSTYQHLLKNSPYKDYESWARTHTYCYGLTLPARVPDTLMSKYIFQDLARQFPQIKASIAKRELLCNVVTKTAGQPLDLVMHPAPLFPEIKLVPGKSILSIKNATIADLLDFAFRTYDYRQINMPFVIEVGTFEQTRFNMELNFSKQNGLSFAQICKELNVYGFQFKQAIRSYPILVIQDERK